MKVNNTKVWNDQIAVSVYESTWEADMRWWKVCTKAKASSNTCGGVVCGGGEQRQDVTIATES